MADACPAWLGPYVEGARWLNSHGVLDILQAVEVGMAGLSLTLLNPAGVLGLGAPATWALRWVANGCGDITPSLRQQLAVAHDYLLLTSVAWAAAGAVVVGASSITVPFVGTIGSAAIVAGIGALMTAARVIIGALVTGEFPATWQAAMVPLTPVGQPAAQVLVWVMEYMGFDVAEVRARMSTPAARERARSAVEATVAESEVSGGLDPMVMPWNPTTSAPPGFSGSSDNGLGLLYSHAYQDAIAATARTAPATDPRPWLAAQLAVDLRIATAMRNATVATMAWQPRAPAFLRTVDEAIRRLTNWQASVATSTPGPWSLATARRLFRQSAVLTNLPTTAGGGDGDSNDDGGGGNGAIVVVLGVLGALALAR